MPQYIDNRVDFTDEILGGSPTYNISGTGAGQSITLDQTVSQAGTPISAVNLGTVEDGIEANDYARRYTTTGSSVVTDHIAYTLSQNGLYTALTGEEQLKFKANVASDTEVGTPTLSVDGLTAKDINFKGITSIEADKTYNAKYNSGLDQFDVSASTFEIPEPSNQIGDDVTLTGSSVTISGLDINADGGYYEIIIDSPTETANSVTNMYVNGDTTPTNYYNNNGAYNLSMSGSNNARIGTSRTSGYAWFKIDLFIAKDRPVADVVTLNELILNHWGWYRNVATTNITSLTIALGSGTFTSGTLKIYKRS